MRKRIAAVKDIRQKAVRGGVDMNKWKVSYLVNGVRSEQIVSTYGSSNARKIVESMYAGQRVQILSVTRVY